MEAPAVFSGRLLHRPPDLSARACAFHTHAPLLPPLSLFASRRRPSALGSPRRWHQRLCLLYLLAEAEDFVLGLLLCQPQLPHNLAKLGELAAHLREVRLFLRERGRESGRA